MNNVSFLSLVMKKIYNGRPHLPRNELFYNRIEQTLAGNSANVWFMTKGCQWDAMGGCTMCNYGKGYVLSDEETLHAVKTGLLSLPTTITELFLSPSGSFLDDNEVSPHIRQKIYKIVEKLDVDYFAFESRAELVDKQKLDELRTLLPNKKIAVEIGLESSDNFVREFCINKGNKIEDFIVSAQTVRNFGFECIANVSVGPAFLSQEEAVNDAIETTLWALKNGADTVVLFPMHVKPYTLLDWLYRRGYYNPPSLWLLIEVLFKLGEENSKYVDISWYRSGYSDSKKIVASPDSCDKCKPIIYELLDEYRKGRNFDVIKKLYQLECDCKKEYLENKHRDGYTPLLQRVLNCYSLLARDFGLLDWWTNHIEEISKEMEDKLC